MEIAALILAGMAFIMALVALLLVVELRGRVSVTGRAYLETQETGSIASQQRGTQVFADAPFQPHTSVPRQVPSTPPQAIAPKLTSPPRPKGGFGSKPKDSNPEEE